MSQHTDPTLPGDRPSRSNMILFWASFLTLIAAGIGFSIRGSILGNWSNQFGFTQAELGTITGGGLVGFGVTIIFFSFLADRVGYRPLMVIAFLFHLSSAIVTLLASPIFESAGRDATYWCLYIGMFLFALGNGTCEAVINPLTATLFPRNKTHWLNILHAGWPAGLVLGALLGLFFENVYPVRWEAQIIMFLIPTLAYGAMMFGRRFPNSEAHATGISTGTMLAQFASPILIILVVLQAMVGYVELGTDSWITNITGTILENKNFGLMLFIWTSTLMFVLRFFAGPIVHKISPLGLLLVSALLGTLGLYLLGTAPTIAYCILAATVYGLGKTFFWPTMLGVVSERFPKGGAIALGIVGGVGMMSAGQFGGPGIGYKQDYFAAKQLESQAPESYRRYKADGPNSFLLFEPVTGLDGSKVAALEQNGEPIEKDIEAYKAVNRPISDNKELLKLVTWWDDQGKANTSVDREPVKEARLFGAQQALISTAFVPLTMAVGYFVLIIIFLTQGGYKQVHIGETPMGGTELEATPQ